MTEPRKRPVRRRVGPGRPEGPSDLRDRILDAAERKFGTLGFEGASLRDIAGEVGVTQALVNYYFHSKQNLFEEAYTRRAELIGQDRLRRLEALRARETPPTLPELIEAFIAGIMALRGSPAGRAFIRLQARLNIETGRTALRLRRDSYDRSSHAYVQEIRRCVPGLTEAQAYTRFVLMVGAYLYAVSDTNRLNELSDESGTVVGGADLMAETVAFLTGGFEAVSRPSQPARKPSPARSRAAPRLVGG
ncbi:TetR/AcrR family transcriptional regulator [Roseomonas indoligenes]|uniref:TetR/AcrR family transcriptional regulator n=1 Tax=Roseomonas indoligenes TaxID=2820811 RepID=A0A940N3L0_9PROT|nr:TetR/AcrR family transcriptional regulator [Pararoseomonas indoligenes]MBP0496082.1 TetR/AcrR family transcriptional regulator [Pararoseomonas indoligenes]